MNEKLQWFVLGFITALVILFAVGYYRTRPINVIKSLSVNNQKAMVMMYPWIKSSRVYKSGPFNVVVPEKRTENREAIITPPGGFPTIYVSNNRIDFADSKQRYISIKYTKSNGEFSSYEYTDNLIKGYSFMDYDLDGQFDVKVNPGYSLAVYYDSKWRPVIRENKERYIEVNGVKKRIETSSERNWKFIEQ